MKSGVWGLSLRRARPGFGGVAAGRVDMDASAVPFVSPYGLPRLGSSLLGKRGKGLRCP